MNDDRQLLARYAEEASEEAFAELARRHTPLVYSAALRQVRDNHLAKDVTQLVFTNLARRARSISKDVILAGWLHRDTRYTALDLLRREARRCRREQIPLEMNAPTDENERGWEEIRPLLDEALTNLPPADRDALLLRFFEQKDFACVGAALGASAEAARKRVDRALDRLRDYLVKRGITTTAAALSGALTAHAVETVPVGLAASVAAGSATATSWISNLLIMTNTKIAVSAALVAGLLTIPLVMRQNALAAAGAEHSRLMSQLRDTPPAIALMIDTSANTARDRADLDRLRREAAILRAKIADFSARSTALVAEQAARKPGSVPLQRILRPRDARESGLATSADTMQTFIAAMMRGDTNRIAELLVIEPPTNGQSIQEVLDKVLAEFAQESKHMQTDFKSPDLDDFSIYLLDQQAGTNDGQWVTTETAAKGEAYPPSGSPYTPPATSRILFRPTAAGWQWVVGADGKPVEEHVNDQP